MNGLVYEARAVKAHLHFKDTCTKTACFSFHSKIHLQHDIIHYLCGILS